MAGVLQHLRSSTLDKRPNPASMVDGQVAINYASGSPGMFFKNSNGDLVKVGPVHVGATAPNVSPASGGTVGNSIGEQWLDTGGGTYVFKIWDGAAWRSEAGEFVNSTGDTMTGSLTMGQSANIIFEGSVDDGFETILTVANPTADRTITLPNVTGTVVTTGDSGSVTSTMIANGTIVDADVNASAAIAGTKVSPNFGSQTVQTTGTFSAAGGSAAAPSIAFTGDTNTGIYSPGADQVALSTNGTGQVFITSNGNTGIGTLNASNVAGKLHLRADGDEFKSLLLLQNRNTGGSAGGAINFVNGGVDLSDNRYSYIRSIITGAGQNGNHLVFGTNANGLAPGERLRITSAGLVGIGSSSPVATNHIRGSGTSGQVTASWMLENASSGTVGMDVTGAAGSSIWRFLRGGGPSTGTNALTPALTIGVEGSAAGNVGIGTTSPACSFHTKITATQSNIAQFESGGGTLVVRTQSAGGGEAVINAFQGNSSGTAVPIVLTQAGSEKVRIDSSGRLLVGTSSAVAATPLLQIEQTTGAEIALGRQDTSVVADDLMGGIGFWGRDTTGVAYTEQASVKCFADGTHDPATNPTRLVFSVTADGSASPSEAMRINNAGELLVGYTSDNGAYKLQVNSQIFATSATIATSDGRYKKNVATLDGCVDLVKALRPVSFDWKVQEPVTRVDEDGETVVVREAHNFPDGKQVGFIAQEVEAVLADKPWLSSVIKQNVRPAVTDNDGNELAPEEKFLGIAEGNLVAVLTSALKDAIGRIESLEAEVAALKA